ncbi:MAG: tRNA lysidine(34) synthetase TilS [Prolixibacteraceae bacterium]|nr:tRNA lysidine(34) synthetase TilS [Prolixibacteraceae bacterium]
MYRKFVQYIQSEKLFKPGDRLLVGISGGPDSVVLTRLIAKTGNPFALAHCNFNLRGADSDGDERFVQWLADDLGVECYLSSFPTKEYAAEKGISVEMAARDLRYNWFDKICIENGFHRIVVGHHLDDVLETFLLNLTRGTGIRGLTGIKPLSGKIIRPLLFATRQEIEDYAGSQGFNYRTDASNNDTTIKRNLIRHRVIPLLEQLNPSFRQNLEKTIGYLSQTSDVFFTAMEKTREKLVKKQPDRDTVSIPKLKKKQPLSLYLYELLRPYNFNSDVVAEIEQALWGEPGKQFFSPTHRLVCDRDELIITQLAEKGAALFYIEKDQEVFDGPVRLHIFEEPFSENYPITRDEKIATIDADKVSFPLVLRKWQTGEYFRPLGMKGLKKLSDFFIDEKYSIPDKENAWILYSGDRVVWIVGKRIDDRVKLTPETKTVLRIELTGSNSTAGRDL